MLLLAVANGAVRQVLFVRHLSELRAHQLSTLTGSIIIGAFIWLVIRKWPPSSGQMALVIGAIWLVLTVGFEFFMGLVLAGRPLNQVLFDYNVLAGRVWVFFLVWLTLAPVIFYKPKPAA
jgi:hypothetical protein